MPLEKNMAGVFEVLLILREMTVLAFMLTLKDTPAAFAVFGIAVMGIGEETAVAKGTAEPLVGDLRKEREQTLGSNTRPGDLPMKLGQVIAPTMIEIRQRKELRTGGGEGGRKTVNKRKKGNLQQP